MNNHFKISLRAAYFLQTLGNQKYSKIFTNAYVVRTNIKVTDCFYFFKVRWLLNMKPDGVNAANQDGKGLLHISALSNNVEMCKVSHKYYRIDEKT